MRQLLGQLNADDIMLTDRYFCSYFMIALLLQMDVDFVALAAMRYKLSPRQLSFANAVQTLAASWLVLPIQDYPARLLMIEAQIESLALATAITFANHTATRPLARRARRRSPTLLARPCLNSAVRGQYVRASPHLPVNCTPP